MGKVTGFLEYKRQTGKYRPVEERLKDYQEFIEAPVEDELKKQGGRCMDCGIPYCHAIGCPVYNLIPEWNDSVYRGDWKEALERLELTNNLPEMTGRVCPAPCETSCTLSINDAPVTIKQMELAIIERGFKEGWVVPHPPQQETGKKVAVVGSGPAGLAAAQQLRRAGHQVTLFEASDKLGGLLRYGIPDFKLEKWTIDRRLDQMRAEGVIFKTNTRVGTDIAASTLIKEFDAVVLTLGAGEARDLPVPGRELQGILFAMPYLTQSNKFVAGDLKASEIISARGRNVLVIGGGDTGSDCVGTANRQGAKKVYQYEILPKPPEWKESTNPQWPLWPNILRTSSSHAEGCERDWSINIKKFTGANGHVQEVHGVRLTWKPSDQKSSPPQMVEVPESEFVLKADLILLAMGFVHVKQESFLNDLGVEFDPRGNIKVNRYATTQPGIFAAGDSHTGASLVVRAIFHGREAAKAVDEYLK